MTAAMRLAAAPVAAGLIAALVTSCTRGEPPSPDGAPSVALPELGPATMTPTSPTWTATSTPGADPAFLPQTRDVPHASGQAFDSRVAALWDAIVEDDPERAMPFFFPLGAYEQVKAIASPAVDWKHRLVAAYAHDIHALHARLDGSSPNSDHAAPGTDAAASASGHQSGTGARLVLLDVPDVRARWVDPGEEYNKVGYFRVFGSKLRYEVNGETRALDVKSLISWRGEWYVVHLSSIK
jgi:hypothetical protein